jgi:hypothetical protein
VFLDQSHPALWTFAGRVLHDVGMHRAGVLMSLSAALLLVRLRLNATRTAEHEAHERRGREDGCDLFQGTHELQGIDLFSASNGRIG